jgi:hypothetical protein
MVLPNARTDVCVPPPPLPYMVGGTEREREALSMPMQIVTGVGMPSHETESGASLDLVTGVRPPRTWRVPPFERHSRARPSGVIVPEPPRRETPP